MAGTVCLGREDSAGACGGGPLRMFLLSSLTHLRRPRARFNGGDLVDKLILSIGGRKGKRVGHLPCFSSAASVALSSSAMRQ